jgi:hypothetical protein
MCEDTQVEYEKNETEIEEMLIGEGTTPQSTVMANARRLIRAGPLVRL